MGAPPTTLGVRTGGVHAIDARQHTIALGSGPVVDDWQEGVTPQKAVFMHESLGYAVGGSEPRLGTRLGCEWATQ